MKILEGKPVSESISKTFEERIKNLKKTPNIAVLGIRGDNAGEAYISRIKRNCEKYGIGFLLNLAETEQEFRQSFENIKNDENITGIMFAQPLPSNLSQLINEIDEKKDIDGVSNKNMGKLFLGEKDVLIPCTSRAVMELLEYYEIELTGKKVVIVGRSNIVGKPLIPQILSKNATVTVCHSKTKNIKNEIRGADVVIMAIGKAKFLKSEDIKDNAILVDVGINFENSKIVGDIDFEDVKEKAFACTPVPGGIGVVTNAILIDNIIKSCKLQQLVV